MESIVIISTDSIFLQVLYKAVIIFISSHMEAFNNEFTTTEMLSYKEVVYDEATGDWYAQRDLDEVGREECNCMRLNKSIENDSLPMYSFTHQHLESYLFHVHYTSEMDNLHDDKEIDYALNKTWIIELVYFECVVVPVTCRSSISEIQRKERL